MKNSKRLRISYNAPAILSFVLICFAVQLLNVLTKGASNRAVFSVYRSSFLDPLAYLRCVCHVFGHANWNHLMGNMMYILILGPMLEEKYGTSNMVFIMLVTALATGLANLIFFPNIRLLGGERHRVRDDSALIHYHHGRAYDSAFVHSCCRDLHRAAGVSRAFHGG